MAISYRGVSIPDFVVVRRVDFSVLPKVSLSTVSIPKRDGLVYTGTSLGEKKISIDILIKEDSGKTPMQQAEELAEWLRGTDYEGFKVGELILDDNPNKFFNAVVSNEVPVSDLISVGEGTIEFKSIDPYSYSTVLHVENYSPNSIGVTYQGSAQYYPKFTVTLTQDVSNPRIDDLTTGDSVKLVGDFSIGDVIEILNDTRQVKVNGAVRMDLLDLSSEWINLSKYKNNSFVLVPDTAADNVGVTFREAYL